MNSLKNFSVNLLIGCVCALFVCACGSQQTPESGEYIFDFNAFYTGQDKNQLVGDSLDLYLDYTTALEMKAKVKFYWEIMRPIVKSKAKTTFAIKGQDISKVQGNVQEIMNGITNYPNADIKAALQQIVNNNKEAIIITDGEMIDPVDPYMKDAFKAWLLKGHDICVISEPYIEKAAKVSANKFVFFIVFYDANMDRNICEYINKVVNFSHFPKINYLNISMKPRVVGLHGGHSAPNEHTQAMVTRKGNVEYHEWNNPWEGQIVKFVVNSIGNDGKEDEKGLPIIDNLKVERNSIAGLDITGVKTKVFNVNKHYSKYYECKKQRVDMDEDLPDSEEMENFIVMNDEQFKKGGAVQLFFDKANFNLDCLDGEPYNYLKVDLYISNMKENVEKYRPMLEFDDILKKDCKNISVFESLKQTIEDPELGDYIANNPFYTIYVKAQKK